MKKVNHLYEYKNDTETPTLDNLGRDLTQYAKENKLEPVIGRDDEIFKVMWVLSRKNKNNPILIGEAGVGKTAIVEGVAQKIANQDCPETLLNKKIIYIDMGTIIATGNVEKVFKNILSETINNPNIIIFIDEIHMIKSNSQTTQHVGDILKPALARGEIKLIGATTFSEFRESIEKDNALNRRFIQITVNEPTESETIDILNKIKNKYEEHHKVSYNDEVIEQCVKLSMRYITDKFLPDKAIDLMDEVGARKRLLNTQKISSEDSISIKNMENELLKIINDKTEALNKQDYDNLVKIRVKEVELRNNIENILTKNKNITIIEITVDDVYEIVALKTGIPIKKMSDDESNKVLNINKDLKIDIVGQDNAVDKISKIIKRSKAGLKDPNRPMGVFLFLGSTGTGKTHTAKMLAKHLFGSSDNLIRIDMSEYKEPHNVSRLIGSPPGYVGYDQAGQLTEKVRRKPYSIILLDEIEKAHPNVMNIFLQVFDEGHLTDGQGRKVDFKNTLIIMTSNIGAVQVENAIRPIGFTSSNDETLKNQDETIIKNQLKNKYPPEFINRIDEIIIFAKLEKENIYGIIDNEMKKITERLKNLGFTLTYTNNIKDMLMKYGFDKTMGARPLKRAIETHIQDPLSDEILKRTVKDIINLDYDIQKDKLIVNGNLIEEKLNMDKVIKWNTYKLFK